MKLCSSKELALGGYLGKVVVYGIMLFRAFVGHILMDEMLTFLLDGHTYVIGSLLHKCF